MRRQHVYLVLCKRGEPHDWFVCGSLAKARRRCARADAEQKRRWEESLPGTMCSPHRVARYGFEVIW